MVGVIGLLGHSPSRGRRETRAYALVGRERRHRDPQPGVLTADPAHHMLWSALVLRSQDRSEKGTRCDSGAAPQR